MTHSQAASKDKDQKDVMRFFMLVFIDVFHLLCALTYFRVGLHVSGGMERCHVILRWTREFPAEQLCRRGLLDFSGTVLFRSIKSRSHRTERRFSARLLLHASVIPA